MSVDKKISQLAVETPADNAVIPFFDPDEPDEELANKAATKADLEGPPGPPGNAATIAVGDVSTVGPEDPATVTNVGTENAAILDFEIPQGEQGEPGPPGSGIDAESIHGAPVPAPTEADDGKAIVYDHAAEEFVYQDAGAVKSVNGQTGDVVLDHTDVGADEAGSAAAVAADLAAHEADTDNPHEVTKAQVGLGNVTNDAQVKAADKASQAEAETGTNDTKWMTPLKTKQAIQALGGGGTRIATNTTVVNLNNSTTETSLISATIPGGTLGTNGIIRVLVNISNFLTGGASVTLTLRLKWGISTLTISGLNPGQNSVEKQGWLEYFIIAAGSATEQTISQNLVLLARTTTYGAMNGIYYVENSVTTSINSANNQTLEVTAQWNSASGDAWFVKRSAFIDKIV